MPSAAHDVDPLEYPRELAAVRVRVHPHRAAHGPGDADAELDPGQPGLRGSSGHRRQAGSAAAVDPRSIQLDRAQLLVQLQDQSADALVRYQEVRPGADDPYLEPLRPRPGQQPLERLERAGAREELGRAAGADRGQARERVVALDAFRLLGHAAQGR